MRFQHSISPFNKSLLIADNTSNTQIILTYLAIYVNLDFHFDFHFILTEQVLSCYNFYYEFR